MITVSFPGIGIENFNLNPIAFSIGPLSVRWYGIIITLGIVLAVIYCAYRARQEGISFDTMLDIAIFTIIFGVVGARAYYVLTSLEKYDSFLEAIAIWEGGLAIYGAVIAGAITIYVTCKIKKISPLKMLDATAPAVMIGQILGRWGNFFNGEAHGTVVAEGSPLYFIRMGLSPHDIEGVRGMAYVHPTFLYESLWNLVGLIIIHCLYKKKKFDGQVLLMYLTWYGFGRMFIEGLRTDSLYIGVFRISQVVGFLCFIVGAILLTVNLLKARRATLTARSYEPSYPKFASEASIAANAANEAASTQSDNVEKEIKEPEEINVSEETQPSEPDDEFIPETKEGAEKRFGELFGNEDTADTEK